MRCIVFILTGLVILASCGKSDQQVTDSSKTDTITVHDTVVKKSYHKRYCMALDLKEDTSLINEYENIHKDIPGAIAKSIVDNNVTDMEIYRIGSRLFMIMEVNEDFSFEEMSRNNKNNPAVQKWEERMWKYQKPLPQAEEGEKWLKAKKIFDLDSELPLKSQ